MRKRKFLTIAAFLVVIAALFGGRRMLSGSAPPPESARADSVAALQRTGPPALPARPDVSARAAAEGPVTGDDARLIAHLRDEYGANIHNAYIQIRMLEKLMRYFQEHHPDNWEEALLAAVRAAFPELYDEIAANLQSRLDYEQWIKENRARLQALDAKAHREAMWEARKQMFGDAAEQIWASELKTQAVASALESIDMQDGTSIADKLAMYRDSLEDVYRDSLVSHLESNRQEAMNRFLDLVSVQQALAEMSPEARKENLREIRKGMGLDEDALSRWDDLDRTRDLRWERGARYMEERAALVAQYQGDALETRLTALRSRYFGDEAEIIAQEEAAGFFRFERPRRWGRN